MTFCYGYKIDVAGHPTDQGGTKMVILCKATANTKLCIHI
jgi:hypothetical protein